jgi:hypothetical protein
MEGPMTTLTTFKDDLLEREARAAVSLEEPMQLLDRFSTLTRESPSEDEMAAARHIGSRLEALGVPFTMHAPELFLSVPHDASVEVRTGSLDETFYARPPAFSRSTDGEAVTGELEYVPSRFAAGMASLFDMPGAAAGPGAGPDPVAGKIIVTEGFSMPGPVREFERRGAIGQIYIHPGRHVHEGICTTIWGTPTEESIARKPRTPVVCVNRVSGDRLIALAAHGGATVALRTRLREGWGTCLLPVAEIPGQEDPDEFLLVHGHYDSWYAGIGDNATGDAALLELARLLHGLRGRLKRSVRIAWWPGHSMGRYAGSTWYADTFADAIDEWCLAQMNIDSPGCAGATAYEEVMWMAEARAVCTEAIGDALGVSARGLRPLRAGDYSFNQIGPTGLYMLLSNIPVAERQARGLYAVGGCGGNIEWHTPDDAMHVFDPEILLRDLQVYATTIVRLLNAPVYPFDYGAAARELREAAERYRDAAAGIVDLQPIVDDLQEVERELEAWQAEAREQVEADPGNAGLRRDVNARLRRIARLLVPLNYARGERFDHDPAIKFRELPRLEAATRLASAPATMRPFLAAGLLRERNKVRATLRAVMRELRT